MRRLCYILLALVWAIPACSDDVEGPTPSMEDLAPEDLATDPSFVCTTDHGDQGTWVTLKGDAFSPLVIDAISSDLDHDVELPTLSLHHRLSPTGEALDAADPVVLESPPRADDGDIRWLDDGTLLFRVTDELDLAPGVYDVEVENPNGETGLEDEAFGVLPQPQLDAAIPEMTCVAQGDRQLRLDGQDLLVGPEDAPVSTVTIDDQQYPIDSAEDCTDLHPIFLSYELCETTTLTVDEASLDPGVHDITYHNPAPADCSSSSADPLTLTIEPPPVVDDIEPTPVCSEQLDYDEVTLSGQGFITLDDASQLPQVTIGDRQYTPESASDCQDIDSAPAMDAQRCQTLTIAIPADDLADQVGDDPFITDLDVAVENPEPVGCHSEEDTTIGVTPPPEITSLQPRIACNNDGTVTYDIEGDHLLEIDGDAPTIDVDGQVFDADPVDCADIDGHDGVRGCQALSVDLDLEAMELVGAQAMTVTNPEPAACTSVDDEPFYAAAPPAITDASPDGFCDDETFGGDLELYGQFLYDPDGDAIVVEIEGQSIDYTLTGCDDAADSIDGLQLCGGLDLDVPASLSDDLQDEEFDVTVTGADPVACGQDTFTLFRTTPPTIDSVNPRRVCSDGSSFEVLGEDLHPEAQAFLDGFSADEVDVAADGTSATVTFGSGLSAGTADFEFVNPGDCGSTYTEEIRVTDGPLAVFVDPPVVFDEMNTQVTIYAAALYDELGGSITDVELLDSTGNPIDLDFSPADGRPNVINAEIPAGLLDDIDDDDLVDGAAEFGVRLTDGDISCSNTAPDLVTITGETTLAIDSISPPFGGQDDQTAVEITAPTDPDAGQVNFQATPRAYLNPAGDSDALGRELRALQFIDATELNAIVPEGLSLGTYDLIVVNPEGEVGVLDDAYEVTEEPAPIVESVSPSAWPTSAISVDVEGQYFRSDPDDPDVEVFCQPTGDDTTDEDLLDQPTSLTVDSVSDSLIELSVDASNLERLSACYMRVTNPDGTFDEYSPITITNPAAKFLEFQQGPDLSTARRAPTTFGGSATRANHYVYAVGGDDGSTDGDFHATGEFSRLDQFGAPGDWSYLPYELPTGRSFADGIRVQDFMYLVGGVDEDGVTNQVLRSRILDPTDTPEIVAVDIDVEGLIGEGAMPGGLDAGTYYYRVAAVYTDDDPANPEGESLASEPQPIQLPVSGTEVTIEWQPPEMINHDIEEYRIYRNVEPDDPYGGETYLATVDADSTSYTDEGDLIPGVDTADEHPLPTGALGTWHEVAQLNTERRSAGITLAPSPDFDDEYFLYAVGGEDADGQLLDDYEVIDIQFFGDRDQDVGDALQGLDDQGDLRTLPEARTAHTAAVAFGANASSVSGTNPSLFVYAGETDGGNDTHIRVATVQSDGFLDEWNELGSNRQIPGGQTSGHAGAIMNNNLVFAGGGSGGDAGDGGSHVDITCDGDCPPASVESSFSSLSELEMQARAWMGAAPFRGFWYHTAGVDTADEPTRTVQFSVAGATP